MATQTLVWLNSIDSSIDSCGKYGYSQNEPLVPAAPRLPPQFQFPGSIFLLRSQRGAPAQQNSNMGEKFHVREFRYTLQKKYLVLPRCELNAQLQSTSEQLQSTPQLSPVSLSDLHRVTRAAVELRIRFACVFSSLLSTAVAGTALAFPRQSRY